MPIPETTRQTLAQRLEDRRQQRWPELQELTVRYRGFFAYIAGVTNTDGPLPLFRLRYLGSSDDWGFGIYLGSTDGYEDSVLPRGGLTGTPEEALDCACGLYLGDITAWLGSPPDEDQRSRENF